LGKKIHEIQNKQALGIRLIGWKSTFMRLSKHLITLLVLLAGFAYSIEATLPAMAAVVIESSGEETEANEKTESLVPVQVEAKRVRHNSSIKVNHPSSVKIFAAYSGKQFFVKRPSILLHRSLLI
jgi:hypothetical protein